MEAEALVGLAGAGIVMGLVAVIRRAVDGLLSADRLDRLTPLAAVTLGIAWNVAVKAGMGLEWSWGATALVGVLSGLSASGLWSGGKSVAGQ